ncbi:MAG: amidohydrolase [Saprospiraceae bacterium]|nr:amidohydrolase [Saprospiraceae bacterium]MBK9728086.1 amidohydrolase [Saprospiraceae bacterium]
MDPIINLIKARVDIEFSKLVDIRRHFHRHPELSFEEEQTSLMIQKILTESQIEFQTGFCKHGIVGTIKAKNPESRIIALRADMDALPIYEKNECAYKSLKPGVMHACGHDVHMTCLLGALQILKDLKEEWEGTVKFIFQPAEEKLPGGASLMIKEGVLENPVPKVILGQHVQPGMDVGEVGLAPGAFMASCDEIYITVKGKGGHAAQAHLCVDPILVAAHLLVGFQAIISREKPAMLPSVLSFGTIHTDGGATNIIPDEVKLSGTFRSLDESWRAYGHKRIEEVAVSICQAYNASCEVVIQKGYPCLMNDSDYTASFMGLSNSYLGMEHTRMIDPRLTSEDFAYYSHEIPAVFYRLGVGDVPGVHTSRFDIDENAIKTGVGLMAYAAIRI